MMGMCGGYVCDGCVRDGYVCDGVVVIYKRVS